MTSATVRHSMRAAVLFAMLAISNGLYAASAPVITTMPVGTAVTEGKSASFSVSAAGSPAPAYQWRRNGTAISGATSESYTTPSTLMADSGARFSVVVSNSAGSVTSTDAVLAVSFYTGVQYHSLVAEAVVTESPPAITLKWIYHPETTQYRIYRKRPAEATWILQASFAASSATLGWIDRSVAVGTVYEYRIERDNTFASGGYPITNDTLCAGINIPPVDSRGTVLLIVDNTVATPLAFELGRLRDDLIGDGWLVKRFDVARGPITGTGVAYDKNAVASVKSIIQNEYAQDPTGTRSVFLFGHVPVPYSGSIAWDGHADHVGAWPADIYYADVDGSWTDNTVNIDQSTPGLSPENVNVPGDGKFDQSYAPTDVELEVGRVDLSNMPVFWPKTEVDLLRQYLNKDHAHRRAEFVFSRQAIVEDYFKYKPLAAVGWRSWSNLFGIAKVSSGLFTNLSGSESYLGYFLCGSGYHHSSVSVTTGDWAAFNPKTGFNMMWGSGFGDWDRQNNFLRAPLASKYSLASVWAGTPRWLMHTTAIGGTFGEACKVSSNCAPYLVDNYSGSDCTSLQGDPTLRFFHVKPPTNLLVTTDGSGRPSLTWTASTDTSLQRYHVYRATNANGPYARLSTSPITQQSWTDTVTSGVYHYQVKAAKLETTGAGTFVNLSQGISASFPQPAGGVLEFAAATYSQIEGNGGTVHALITVNRLAGATGAASVNYATSPATATAPADYAHTQGILSWPAGDASPRSFTVPIIADTVMEEHERINLSLSSPVGAALRTSTANLLITNDDATTPSTISFSSPTYTQVEGSPGYTLKEIRIQRSGGGYGAVGVTCSLSDGTATFADGDYTSFNYDVPVCTVSWGDGESQFKSVYVRVNGDAVAEGDEFVTLTLSQLVGVATLGSSTAQLWIVNDDGNPTMTAPSITTHPANVTVVAGQTATFSVVATGTPSPTYQWQKNGMAISGATSASYTTPATVIGDHAAQFSVVASNSAGSVTANSATLTVSAAPSSGTGLVGAYFANQALTGSAVLTRIDPIIYFDWGYGSPGGSVPVDAFSVRWTGQVQALASEAYTFYVTGDDGVRLWVNNVLLIDKWIDQGPTEWSGVIALTAGAKYDVKLEYYEKGGGAVARLAWSSPSTPKAIIPQGQLFPSAVSMNTAPVTNAGPDRTVALPAAVTLDGSASDDGLPNPPSALGYAWSTVSGPGAVSFASAGSASTSATFSSAGSYVLRLTANDGALSGSDDVVVTVTAGTGTGMGTGLTGSYFTNQTLTGTATITRTDATINFDWGNGSPGGSVPADGFSARWTGHVQAPVSETYTFYVTGDDGVRLWVNNVLLVDKWIDQGATEWSGTIALTAGSRYEVKLEYYDRSGDAVAKLAWSSPSTPKATVPQSRLFPDTGPRPVAYGWAVTYFDNADLTGASLARIDATIDFNWGDGSPDVTIGAETFSAQWLGLVTPAASETYTFHVTGDDGVRLWVNNVLIIDKWIDQGPTTWTGTAALIAGQGVSVRMEYYEKGGGAMARLEWSSPTTARAIIPQSAVIPSAGSAMARIPLSAGDRGL